jgi:hypothetical protein
MFTLKSRRDGFRLLFPKDFIPEHITEKYTKILQENRSFITTPIDFINESIQKIDILGFNNATYAQSQTRRGDVMPNSPRYNQNNFLYPESDTIYRSPANPQSLIDKTLNVTFRHTLGYMTYFIIFESFLYFYSRDAKNKDAIKHLSIDLLDSNGSIYSKIFLKDVLIDGIDMLSFDYTQPVAESQTFNVIFKYSNFDYQFIQAESNNWNGETE